MVKVLPTTFTLFESQNIINSSSEPLCITCSDKNVFIACEGCVLEVYTLSTKEQIAKVRTIWPVTDIVYNKHADCIVTLEARSPDSAATCRVYFNWRGIGDFNRPHRVVLMGSLLSQEESVDAEIVELPVENCSCLSVCELTGAIAVCSERVIQLFALVKENSVSLSTGGYKLGSVLEVRTDMKLRSVKICGNYIACISTHRIRVIKFLITGTDSHPWSEFQSNGFKPSDKPKNASSISAVCKAYRDFLLWSPSYVWETESKMPKSQNNHPSTSKQQKDSVSELSNKITAHNTLPDVSTITMPSITRAITEARRDTGKHELEVLGPVEYVWGQPLTLESKDDLGANTKCRSITMLYRRFASTGYAYVHVSNDGSLPRATPNCDPMKQRSATMGGKPQTSGGWGGRHRGGIHTVQLVPTVAMTSGGHKELIGMSCVLANRIKGYVYDIFERCKLITAVSFMSRSQTVCFDGDYFHSLSGDTVDTYTSRILSSVISGQNTTNDKIEGSDWISLPCPPPSLELTLISSNKFIGCFDLVSSATHNVVLCKLIDESPPMQPASSFLESFSMKRRKQTSRGTWNIYVLKKKPVVGMYKQFVDFATSHGEGLPPVMQHHLSEAHLLLRKLVIQQESPSPDVLDLLRDNCFSLAQSLCQHPGTKSSSAVVAAGYYMFSKRSIVEIINHVLSQYSEGDSKLPFVTLVKYLNMALFEPANAFHSETLCPLADQILDLYTKYDYDRLPEFVLLSWFKRYSKEKALDLLQTLLSRIKRKPNDLNCNMVNLALCTILCDLDRLSDAVDVLSRIAEHFLIKWIKDHPQFILNNSKKEITAFGNAVMKRYEGLFVEFLLFMLVDECLDWDYLCEIMNVSKRKVLTENQLLKKLLESIVTDKNHPCVSSAVELLAVVLINRIFYSTSCSTSTCVQFGTRHSWLNRLPPFENAVGGGSECILYANASQSCFQDLIELQSLLCSTHMTSSLAAQVDSIISEFYSDSVITMSLKLLTWPFLDKASDATWLLLAQFPSIVVEYCKVYYQFDLAKWKIVLTELQTKISKARKLPEKDTLKAVYEDSLKYAATLTSPEEFLALLPSNGNIIFFLPMIENSCKLYLAGNMSRNIQKLLL